MQSHLIPFLGSRQTAVTPGALRIPAGPCPSLQGTPPSPVLVSFFSPVVLNLWVAIPLESRI